MVGRVGIPTAHGAPLDMHDVNSRGEIRDLDGRPGPVGGLLCGRSMRRLDYVKYKRRSATKRPCGGTKRGVPWLASSVPEALLYDRMPPRIELGESVLRGGFLLDDLTRIDRVV